ncbi:uncharacterized protein [Lepisosteus oculatus]|uniref:uncharacterized protein isoform X2 n=1 Tax=Lepisosteus oculatus TaxID=7918 RepID=UPI0035F50400
MICYTVWSLALFLVSVDAETVSVKLGDEVTLFCNVTVDTQFAEDQLCIIWQNAEDQNVLTFCGGYEEAVTLESGDTLSVSLYSSEPLSVLFDPEGEGDSIQVCQLQNNNINCIDKYQQRATVQDGSLLVPKITPADQGQYIVRNTLGHVINIVSANVKEYREHHTLPAGGSLTIPVYTREKVVMLFHPSRNGDSFELCTLENGIADCHDEYNHAISFKGEGLVLHGLTPEYHGKFEVLHRERNVLLSHVSLTVKDHKEHITLQTGAVLIIRFYTDTPVKVLFFPPGGHQPPRTLLNHSEVLVPEDFLLKKGCLVLKRVTPAHQGIYKVQYISKEININTVAVTVADSERLSDFGSPYFEKRISGKDTGSENLLQDPKFLAVFAVIGVLVVIILVMLSVGLRRRWSDVNGKLPVP